MTQAGLSESVLSFDDADLSRQSHVLKRVLAGSAGAAVVASQVDDVGASLGDADGNDTDAWHNRHLDRHPGLGVGRFQLLDELRQVLDGINIVVVGRRDEVNAWPGVTSGRHFDRYLASGEMAAFAWLGPLAYLELQQVRRVDQVYIYPKAAGGDLLAAIVGVFAHQILDLAPFAVERDHIQPVGGLSVGTEGDFALRTKGH